MTHMLDSKNEMCSLTAKVATGNSSISVKS